MSQENGSGRVSGFVVGSNKGGRVWIVRVKDESSELNQVKLRVINVRTNTVLKPGLDVSFRVEVVKGDLELDVEDESVAADVVAVVNPPAEEKVVPDDFAEDTIAIRVMVTRLNGEYHAYFTPARSVKEAQEDVRDAGSDEKIVSLTTLAPTGTFSNEPAINAILALTQVCSEQDDSIGQTLEELLTRVFLEGVKVGRNIKR